MSTTAFGEPTYSGPEEAPATTTSGPNGAAQQELVDPNDPRLISEMLSENPEGDAYAVPPPLPDGKWRAKLKQVDIEDDKGQKQRYAAFTRAKMANGQPFLATNVEFTILDSTGKYDGTKLTEYWVKTLVEQRSRTSQVATLLTKLKQPLAPANQAGRMDQFLRVLAAEPELVVETAWSAECMECQEAAKKAGERAPRAFLSGMHRFPQTRTGPDPVVKCPKGHQVRAQVRIVNFFPLDSPHNP
jgi:hypothetical protein